MSFEGLDFEADFTNPKGVIEMDFQDLNKIITALTNTDLEVLVSAVAQPVEVLESTLNVTLEVLIP